MRIYETWSEIGQNEVNSMAWLGPGFHPSYSGVQPKISVLPVIPLESFQVSATVTEMGILAFPCRIEKPFAVVASFA